MQELGLTLAKRAELVSVYGFLIYTQNFQATGAWVEIAPLGQGLRTEAQGSRLGCTARLPGACLARGGGLPSAEPTSPTAPAGDLPPLASNCTSEKWGQIPLFRKGC